eukprot:486535_1
MAQLSTVKSGEQLKDIEGAIDEKFETLPIDIFLEDFAKKFKCEKCPQNTIPINPYMCDKGHSFCKKCINICIEQKENCPNGDHEVTDSQENVFAKNMINGFMILCPINIKYKDINKNNNIDFKKCEWNGTVQLLLQHLKECNVYKLYMSYKNMNKTDIQINQLKNIMNEIKTENISLKHTIDKLSKSLINIQKELNDIKQNKHEIINEDVIVNDEKKYEDEAFDTCSKCNKILYSSDFDSKNIFWDANNRIWNHINCYLRQIVSKLGLEDIDEWHPSLTNKSIQIVGKYTVIGGGSQYLNSFGIISVDKGVKKWDIKINEQPNYSYIGIISTHEIENKHQGRINKNCYYISYDGKIQGANVNISTGKKFTKTGVVSILLDKNKNKLCFCVNNEHWIHAKGAVLKGSYNLFCTSYHPKTSFTILGAVSEKKIISIGNCVNCNGKVTERDFSSKNVYWDNKQHKWIHIECNIEQELVPKLEINDMDQWNLLLSHSLMNSNSKYSLRGGTSQYLHSFGIITVKTGIKVWNIKINEKPDHSYVGIIDSNSIKSQKTGSGTDNGYYLKYDGCVKGRNVDIPTGHKLKENDQITIVLNMKEYT